MDFQQILNQILSGSLIFLTGLGYLFVFWLIALLAAAIVRAGLRRTTLDERLAHAISGGEGAQPINVEKWVARLVFYIILLFGVVAFLNQVNLQGVSTPIQTLLDKIFEFIPNLLGALAILLGAWVVASVVKFLILQIAARTKLDERLSKQAALGEEDQITLSSSIANAAYWLIFLLFLPAIFGQLNLQGLVEPVQNMVNSLLQAVPNVFSAGIALLIGWFIARIIRQVVANLLRAAGADQLGERVGLRGEQSLSKLVGTIVYALILIPTIVSALGELQIEAISGPATVMLTTALDAIPGIFGALLILALAYLVARLISGLVTSILKGVGFDNLPEKLGMRAQAMEGQRTPSELVGYLVVVALMLFAATEAANMVGFTLLADMIANFTTFGGQVLLALVIFAIGVYLANVARSVVLSTGGQQATFTGNLARIAIMVFAGALALRQMGIADEIVNLAFGILLGAIGVAAALAFGLGSRDLAGREVENWLSAMRSSKGDGA
ncbi:MAG: mechanosensitive ion channel [Anaerolineales bacterium]